MKIEKEDIKYVEYICGQLPTILNDLAYEIEKEDYCLCSSENRARFNRLRIEMNKILMKIKRDIYC